MPSASNKSTYRSLYSQLEGDMLNGKYKMELLALGKSVDLGPFIDLTGQQ